MGQFAADTSVSVERSRAEIERTIQRYGADSFGYGWESGKAVVMFQAHNRRIRFVLALPDAMDLEFWETPTGRQRAEKAAFEAWEQACRQRWRALNLVIKAKLEAVEANISEFEDEFMAHIVLPNGTTFGDWARPQIDESYKQGTMPPMLQIGPAS